MFEIEVHGPDNVVEDSQFNIFPLSSVKVNVPLVKPAQIVDAPAKVPPRETGATSTLKVKASPTHP